MTMRGRHSSPIMYTDNNESNCRIEPKGSPMTSGYTSGMRSARPAAKRLLSTVAAIAVVIAIASLAGCTAASVREGSPASGAKAASPTSISIRNATTKGGLAYAVGKMLQSNGYTYDNGYTIDIGNAIYSSTNRSLIITQRGNETLQTEAVKLHDLLGFEIHYEDEFIDYARTVNSDNDPSSSVFIVLGQNDADSAAFNEYKDGKGPFIYANDTETIVQIEPQE